MNSVDIWVDLISPWYRMTSLGLAEVHSLGEDQVQFGLEGRGLEFIDGAIADQGQGFS